MKQKIVVLVTVLVITVNMGAAAQGQPVIDITAIIAAIENGYTMVQQLQSMYETMRTNYDQLQKQIKSFESFDINTLDAKDPLGSWKSLTTYANRMMTYEQNIESIINKKDLKIGNATYSLSDLFISPIRDAMKDIPVNDPFEKILSPEERAIFLRKYGIAYGHYIRLREMGEILQKKSTEIIAYSGNLQKNLTEDRERLNAIADDMFGNESIVKQQQINNAVMSIMAQDMKTQANLVGNIAAQLATAAAQVQMEKDAIKNEINMNSLDFADGLMKMLDEIQASKAYR